MPPYLVFSVWGHRVFHVREVEFFPVNSLRVINWLPVVASVVVVWFHRFVRTRVRKPVDHTR